jgi:hypothetical protein
MTDEERNRAQDILDGLLRDEYMRGFQDCLVSSLFKSESESIIKEMLEALKMAESEIRCQQLEADFNYNRCHGIPNPTLEEMELEGKWCDEVYELRKLIKRVEGEVK